MNLLRRKSSLRVVLAAVVAVTATFASASAVKAGTIVQGTTSYNYTSYAYDGVQSDEADSAVTGLVSTGAHPATASQNGASSTTGLTFSPSSINLTFAHADTATSGSYAGSGATDNNGNITDSIVFQVTSDSTYTLAGSYSAVGNTFASFRAILLDYTNTTTLFDNLQETGNSGNFSPSFVLGDGGGATSGSLTGVLHPGINYLFVALPYIVNTNLSGPGATASGSVTLTVGSTPEPMSLALLAPAGALLIKRKKR